MRKKRREEVDKIVNGKGKKLVRTIEERG